MALDAVWPRPQIEASRMAWPISFSRLISCVTEPNGWRATRRCSNSSWRTVPTRQGTHCPQVSSRKNAAMRSRIASQIDGVVEQHDDAGAERCANGARAFEGERCVEFGGRNESSRRAAQQNGLQSAGSADAAGKIDQVSEGCAEGDFVNSGPRDVAGEAKQSVAGGVRRADAA